MTMESTKKNVIIITMILFITVENIYAPGSDDDDEDLQERWYIQQLLQQGLSEHELPPKYKHLYDYGSYDYGNSSTGNYGYGTYETGNPNTGNYETENPYYNQQYNESPPKKASSPSKSYDENEYGYKDFKGGEEDNNRRVFNPVTMYWQETQTERFNLEIINNFVYVFENKSLDEPRETVSIRSDGNCFYRALSYWITGSEDYHSEIRKRVAKVVMNSPLIEDFAGGASKLEEHLLEYPVEKDGIWGTDIEIFAATLLLDTSIYVYSTEKESWQLFHKNMDFSISSMPYYEECIYLRSVGANHYDVVIDV